MEENKSSISEKLHVLVVDDWCTEDELKSLDKELVYYFSRGKENVLKTDSDPTTFRLTMYHNRQVEGASTTKR